MDDGSEVDMPATASQECNLPVVTHASAHTGQAQVPNKSTLSHRSVCTSNCTVPDDEEEGMEEDLTDQEDEGEDDNDIDEVAAEEVENREENSVGDEVSCSLPKVYLYTLWL